MLKAAIFLILITLSFAYNLRFEHAATSSSKNPWLGFLIGPLLIVLAFPIIWYN